MGSAKSERAANGQPSKRFARQVEPQAQPVGSNAPR